MVSSNKYYDDFSIRYKNKDVLSFDKPAAYEFNKIKERLNLSKPRKIIEIGCGIGEYALALVKLGHEVTAVDTSRASLALLVDNAVKYKLDKRISVICNDHSKPLFDNKFDIGLCISAYHAFSENEKKRIKILLNFAQSIKPGGVILLVEPNPLNPLFYFFYLFFPNVQRKNIKTFLGSTEANLKRVLYSIGFRTITVHHVGFLPLRFIKYSSLVVMINETINRIPFINKFSSFHYIMAYKQRKRT